MSPAARWRLAATLLLPACGGVGAPADMDAYKRVRFTPGGEEVARLLPKLTAEADARYADAQKAEDAGRVEEAAHLARVARWQFLGADAYSQRKVQQLRLADVQNRQRLLDARLADARQRERDATEARMRAATLDGMAAAVSALGDAPAATPLNGALRDLRAAYARDAARLDPAGAIQALTALRGGLKAAAGESSGTPEAGLAVDRAVAHCGRLLHDVTPRFEDERRRAEVEQRLRVLLAAVGKIPEVEARLEGRGLVVTLRQLFADGSTDVMPHRLALVDRVAAVVAAESALPVRVEGHTDARTDADAAQATSEARARSVAARLTGGGLPPERVSAVGRGGADPVADNGTKEGRARNRRIEIVVLRQARI